MVAYGFKWQFASPIRDGIKRHTIRLPRKRHARPGEALQLYVGMRTKSCFKIMDDPVCTRVAEIRLEFGDWYKWSPDSPSPPVVVHNMITGIAVDGIPMSEEQMTGIAIADGFLFRDGWNGMQALHAMSQYWTSTHGTAPWEGVIVYWEPKP
jgi:hypothetical protein